jgi:hypothetical protein
VVAWFLFRTRGGLVLRAVGEAPESAHALGYPVRRIRFAALAFGGACAGLAGAYLSTVHTPLWSEGMVSGRGWIALALVTFATWRPGRVLLGAYLFGGVTMLQFYLQGQGVDIGSQWLAMTPYLATIVVLALISRNPRWIRLNMPASLGKPFNPNARGEAPTRGYIAAATALARAAAWRAARSARIAALGRAASATRATSDCAPRATSVLAASRSADRARPTPAARFRPRRERPQSAGLARA